MAVMETVKKMRESVIRQRPAGAELREVEFTLRAPKAQRACIAGNFNDWNATAMPMKKDKDGTWRIKVKLSPRQYEYKYVVDGTWVQDTACSRVKLNPFGSYNCIIDID